MEKVIKDFLENKDYSYGFMPLCMTTGSGKTFSSTRVICDLVKDVENLLKSTDGDEDKDLKIFYTTNQLKNLPKKELRKRFREAKRERLYDKYCLELKSNVDSAYDFLTGTEDSVKKFRDSMPSVISNLPEYKHLLSTMEFRKQLKELRKYEAHIKKNAEEAEEMFRYKLEEVLKDLFKTSDSIKRAIFNKPEWKWVAEMYPSVLIFDRKVIFLSFKKLMVKIDPIYRSSFYIYNEPQFAKSILFVDEVDATKDTIIEAIIEDGIKQSQDYIAFFRHLYNPLNENDFPEEFTAESEHFRDKREKQGYTGDDHSPMANYEALRDKIVAIYNECYLSTNFRTKPGKNPAMERFLIRTNSGIYTLGPGKITPWILRIIKDGYNYIMFDEKPPEGEDVKYIRDILNSIQKGIDYFITWLSLCAENYEYYKWDQGKTMDEINRVTALNSVLDNFGDLTQYEKGYLVDKMQKHDQVIRAIAERQEKDSSKSEDGSSSDEDDKRKSFYETGFTTYAFIDNNNHEMRSEIRYSDFSLTAEKFFLQLCKTFKVVGISATADLRSALGNYDMEYLKKELGGAYHAITEEERASLEKQYCESISGYGKVKISAGAVPSIPRGPYSEDWWSDITQDAKAAEEMFEYVQKNSGHSDDSSTDCNAGKSSDPTYVEKRYYRIAYAYSVFLRKGIQAFLCVLNKIPREGDGSLDTNVLDELFGMVGEAVLGAPHKPQYVVLESAGFEEDLTALTERYAKGEHVFIISTYQSIGNGLNMQFRSSDEIDSQTVKTNDFELSDKMDISGIYLDNPSNLIVNIFGDTLDEKSLYKYMYQVESLLEMGEISESEAGQCLNAAYQSYLGNKKIYAPNLYGTDSCYMYAARLLIQAVGRICRTNKKASEITVLVSDKALGSVLHFKDKLVNPDSGKPMLLNPEFKKVIELAEKYFSMSQEMQDLINENNQKCRNASDYISGILDESSYIWSSYNRERWKNLREFVLKHPTISEEEYGRLVGEEKFFVDSMYCRLFEKGDQIAYGQTDDYADTSTSFNPDSMHRQTVSEGSARLALLLKDEKLRQHFISMGYATAFKSGKYILCPVLFNNIYKGALGEEAGRNTVTRFCGIELSEIADPKKFEVFDFSCPAKDVYFDFKHWKDSYFVDKDEMLKKISDKLVSIGGKAVFVINMLGDSSNSDFAKNVTGNGLKVYEIPYIISSDTGEPNIDALQKIKEAFDELNQD
ncbi:MAG: hypothetical protein LUE27_01585 [Clostridia bacterium]|nr:hypothetical protein [Clostridia bacterium]